MVICGFGLILTAVSAGAVARVDQNAEQRLLEIQTQQVATLLSTAILLIEQPMATVLSVESEARSPDEAATKRLLTKSVGPAEQFVSASLWERTQAGVRERASVGARPGMAAGGPEIREFLDRALASPTFVVARVDVGEQSRFAYARADPASGLIVYTERAIPADRRAPVDRNAAFTDLRYAIYLGPRSGSADLTTTNVDPSALPLEGDTARASVPFGDTTLTLVTSPRRHLGSPLSQRLPLLILIGGGLLSALTALVTRRLVRSRAEAEGNSETITELYERVDTLFGEQRTLFVHLQRALLPQTIPDIPGLEIASEYVAGAKGIDIGGDWYSIVERGGDEFAFVVGDVSGRGVDAVAVMAQARFTLRAYLLDGQSPQVALEKCSGQFDILVDGHITTVIVGVGNWRTGEITVANAGHPRPLMLTDGRAEFVPMPIGPPLGTGATTYVPTTFVLPEGSALISYTDGLIERRTEDIDTGMRRLAEVVEHVAPEPLDVIIAEVLDALRDDEEPDDIAVLALRRVAP
ncbi:MAG: hypothetical protein JWP31_2436 [Aeromicrobium sp.]|nr:hypothetical protein [Aeromicrobium sp.]